MAGVRAAVSQQFPALLAAACAGALLAGCMGAPGIKGVGAERLGATEQATEMQVSLELTNAADAPVELTVWEYSAYVNGRKVYEGRWVAALTLPAKVPMTTALPVVVDAKDASDLEHATWSISGSVGYRATRQVDRLLYQLGFNRLYAGFDASGTGIAQARAK